MNLLVGLIFGFAGALCGLQGGRALARAGGRRHALQAGALLLVALSLLALSVSQSPIGWVFILALGGYAAWTGTRSVMSAAHGRVGRPLTPEQTAAFLSRAETDEGIATIELKGPAAAGEVALPERHGNETRPGHEPPSAFDEDRPPSL